MDIIVSMGPIISQPWCCAGGEQPYVSSEGHNLIDLKYDGKFKLFGDVSEPYHKLEEGEFPVCTPVIT
jgi:hypothetical protein